MKPCWQGRLGEAGEKRADALLKKLLEVLSDEDEEIFSRSRAGTTRDSFADIVFDECVFRLGELPKRTKAYQKKYLRENS